MSMIRIIINLLLLVVVSLTIVLSLGGCAINDVSAQEQPVAFIQTVNYDGDREVFVHDSNGITQVTNLGYIRELQGLNGNLVSLESQAFGKEVVYVLNVESGKLKLMAEIKKTEPFPLISKDSNRLLTVAKRLAGYKIHLISISPPTLEVVGFSELLILPLIWPCSGDFAYFLQAHPSRIIRLDINSNSLKDVTPPKLFFDELLWVSVSCDEKTLAVTATGAGQRTLNIFRNNKLAQTVKDGVEPDVSKDGMTVVYVTGFGTHENRIMRYDVATDKQTELTGPTGYIAQPVFLD